MVQVEDLAWAEVCGVLVWIHALALCFMWSSALQRNDDDNEKPRIHYLLRLIVGFFSALIGGVSTGIGLSSRHVGVNSFSWCVFPARPFSERRY